MFHPIIWCTIVFTIVIRHSTGARLWNAAIYKPAYQSNDIVNAVPHPATLANNGDLISNIIGHCQHTNLGYPGWWMVDTLGIHVFQQIVLTNRGDVSATRLKSFRIDVFTTDPRKMPGFPLILGELCMNRTDPVGIGTFTWNCTGPIIGRYVRLIKYDSDYLNFCELGAMVSDMISTEDTRYAGQMNRRLTQTAMIVSADGQSPASCAMMCITRRYTDYCSAFNWLSSSNRCELFSLDPRNLTLSSRLVATQGVEFFLEKN